MSNLVDATNAISAEPRKPPAPPPPPPPPRGVIRAPPPLARGRCRRQTSTIKVPLFSVASHETGWGERLRNDLFCVEWDVKPYSVQFDSVQSPPEPARYPGLPVVTFRIPPGSAGDVTPPSVMVIYCRSWAAAADLPPSSSQNYTL